MNKTIIVPHKYYANVSARLEYYPECYPRNSYDGDDEWNSRQTCHVYLYVDDTSLRYWYYTDIVLGKGFSKQRDEFIKSAFDWFAEYRNEANAKREIHCDAIGWHRIRCPLLVVDRDSKQALCRITPSYWGYSGIRRAVPDQCICDVHRIMREGNTWEVSGSKLSLYEFWKCSTGEAAKELENVKWK